MRYCRTHRIEYLAECPECRNMEQKKQVKYQIIVLEGEGEFGKEWQWIKIIEGVLPLEKIKACLAVSTDSIIGGERYYEHWEETFEEYLKKIGVKFLQTETVTINMDSGKINE